MPRKKKPETLEELYAERENVREDLRKAKQKEKILERRLNNLTRNARTHRLCTRGAMLESFLPDAGSVTDEELMSLLQVVFRTKEAQSALEKLDAETKTREPLTE